MPDEGPTYPAERGPLLYTTERPISSPFFLFRLLIKASCSSSEKSSCTRQGIPPTLVYHAPYSLTYLSTKHADISSAAPAPTRPGIDRRDRRSITGLGISQRSRDLEAHDQPCSMHHPLAVRANVNMKSGICTCSITYLLSTKHTLFFAR